MQPRVMTAKPAQPLVQAARHRQEQLAQPAAHGPVIQMPCGEEDSRAHDPIRDAGPTRKRDSMWLGKGHDDTATSAW